MCEPGAVHWIDAHLHDCVYGTRDIIGFTFGIVSIGCWVVAQIPQFVLNIKRQSVEALSSWFLAQWLLGDTCNLVGCLLTGSQLPTQTWTAGYFIFADMVMMIQYIFYMALQNQRDKVLTRRLLWQQRHLHYMHSRGSDDCSGPLMARRPADEEAAMPGNGSSAGSGAVIASNSGAAAASAPASKRSAATRLLAGIAAVLVVGTVAFGLSHSTAGSSGATLGGLQRSLLHRGNLLATGAPKWAREAGVFLGWLSSFFYLSSRLSQLYKNWSRKCCEGLSLSMFLCAISANISYGLGILLRTYSWDDLRTSGPWLLGSLGVVLLDVLISLQGCVYPKEREGRDHKRVREPLLVTRPAPAQAFLGLEAGRRSM